MSNIARDRRRRWLIPIIATGAAGAAAAVYWWYYSGSNGENDVDVDQESAEETEQHGSLQEGGHHGLDSSMHEHFNFIQVTSTPQEVQQLLPRLQSVIYEMTDVKEVLSKLPQDATSRQKLHVLAQNSIARTLGAAWVLPCADLLVRAKLSILGRHLFLQERLSDLPVQHMLDIMHSRSRRAADPWEPRPPPAPGLPPRLDASVITAFLPCEHFLTNGCHVLMSQVLQTVDQALNSISLEEERSPADLIDQLKHIHNRLRDVFTPGSVFSWSAVLLGQRHQQGYAAVPTIPELASSMEALLLDPQRADMLQELQAELYTAINSLQTEEALEQLTHASFSQAVKHVAECFPGDPAAPAAGGWVTEFVSEHQQRTDQGPQHQAESSSSSFDHVSESEQDTKSKTWTHWFQSYIPSFLSSKSTPVSANSGRASDQQQATTGRESEVHAAEGHSQGGGGSTVPSQHLHTGATGGRLPWCYDVDVASSSDPSWTKPARPTARLLRPVQAACDGYMRDAVQLSQRAADMPAVAAWSAGVFARQLE